MLREYQKKAVDAALNELESDENALVVLPTGAGKTYVILSIVNELRKQNKRCLVLSHRKELIEQTAATFIKNNNDVSIVSAGLNKFEFTGETVIAGIQTFYSRLENAGAFDVVLIDEVHLLNQSNDNSMYTKTLEWLNSQNNIRVVGLTATPFRLDNGLIYGPGKLFKSVCYTAKTGELISGGYLCKLINKAPLAERDVNELNKVSVVGGDYKKEGLTKFYSAKFDDLIHDIKERTKTRRAVIIFCPSIDYAKRAACRFENSAVVSSFTPSNERQQIVDAFKKNLIRYVFNVDVLTTGFDAPNIDCVCLLRATLSAALYVQMVGRGLRLSAGKDDCLILDYGGNIRRFGGLDNVTINAQEAREKKATEKTKVCQNCFAVNGLNARRCCECKQTLRQADYFCPRCGAPLDNRDIFCPACNRELKTFNSIVDEKSDIIKGCSIPTLEMNVKKTLYFKHVSKRNGKTTLEVKYVGDRGEKHAEFICFEHTGFARMKAEQWFKKHFPELSTPSFVDSALYLLKANDVQTAKTIRFKPAVLGKYENIIDVKRESATNVNIKFNTLWNDAKHDYKCRCGNSSELLFLLSSFGGAFCYCPKCGVQVKSISNEEKKELENKGFSFVSLQAKQ